jgi:Mrp family chromosome partitioning ATPase
MSALEATSSGGAAGVTHAELGGPSLARQLIDLRFIVLSGKGGVGRTTVAAALARAAQRAGKRVLVAQTDAAERLGHMLGYHEPAAPIGPVVRTVDRGLDVVNMTPRESLHQYALLVLKYETVYRALFENRAVRGFLSAVPGLDAYAMLGKAWWHTTETTAEPGRAGSRRKYDLVILDGPASGHAITMLKIPGAILATMPAGPLAKDARALVTLLGDPTQSALVVVTRAEELPARETVELVAAARALPAGAGGAAALGLGPLLVNALPGDALLEPRVEAVLDRLPRRTGDATLDEVLALATVSREQARAARRVLAELARAPGLPMIGLPALPRTSLGPDDIERLAARLMAAGDPRLSGPAPERAPGASR